MKRFILPAILLGVIAIAAGAIAPATQAIPDLRGQWTGYNAQGQNIGVNKITQNGRSITFHHLNGQVTSGASINDRRSLYVPVWRSTGIISADGNRIDFKGGSMDGIYFVREGGSGGGDGGTVDPTGTWRHHSEATWTITRAADGRFHAQESGLGNASGPGYFTSSGTFRIDYTTRDGAVSGYYEVRFSPDGRTATGTVRELNGPRRTADTNWSREGGAPSNTGAKGESVVSQSGTGITINIRAEFEPKKGVDGVSNLDYTCAQMNIPAGAGTLEVEAVETPYYAFQGRAYKELRGKNWFYPPMFFDAPFYLPDMCRNDKLESRPDPPVNEAPATFKSVGSCANYGKPFTLTICIPAMGYNTTPNCFTCPPGWAQLRQIVDVKATWIPFRTSTSPSSGVSTAPPTTKPTPVPHSSKPDISPTRGEPSLTADFGRPPAILTRDWVTNSGITKSFFEGDQFHVQIQGHEDHNAVFWYPRTDYDDFELEVNGQFVDGPQAWVYGLAFRQKDGNFYIFLVGYNGDYVLDKHVNGQWQRIREWTKSQYIKPGAVNKLGVVCRGTTIALYANNHRLVSVTDDTLSSGAVGLYVQGQPNIHVAFDNFTVRSVR